MTKPGPGPRELLLRQQREERWARSQAEMKATVAQKSAAKSVVAAAPTWKTRPVKKAKKGTRR